MTVRNSAVVRAPVLHNLIGCSERAARLAVAAGSKPCAGPGRVGSFHKLIRNLIGQLYRPALGNLENRTEPLNKIKPYHGSGHFQKLYNPRKACYYR